MDPRAQIDQLIDGVGRISLLAQLRDKVVEASQTTQRKCGNCYHWMKSSDCPMERRNPAGRRVGPSMNAPACGKFQLEQWVADLRSKRIADAIAFAEKHDLPVPQGLSAALSKAEAPHA
jgi:hypothetical protein